MASEWFPVDQPDPRFSAEGKRLFGPFYFARVLDTRTGGYLRLDRPGRARESSIAYSVGPLTGRSSVRRAVKYGIERYVRAHPDPS